MSRDSGSIGVPLPALAPAGPPAAIRVMVVDDHTLMRQGLRALLETFCKFTVVGEAGDGEAAVHVADEVNPDVVLMDINLPGLSGIEATRRIRSAHPAIHVVGLSMLNSPEVRDAMLRAGATIFISKSAEAKEVCAAVRAAAGAA